MKILYYIPSLNTVGADRWIYEGWRDAFVDKKHNFSTVTDFDNFRQTIEKIKPDILFIHNLADIVINNSDDLLWARELGIKVFLIVYWPLREKEVEIIKTKDIADIYFGEREHGSMVEFEAVTGRKYHIIPNAANKLLHFPVKPIEKYRFDIVYMGANLPKKREMFKSILFPLKKKYKLGLIGPYWTIQDNILRLIQKIFKKVKFSWGFEWINKMRVQVPSNEENILYSSAKICLNFHEREEDGSQPHRIVNQRTFKIAACGGFQLCDYVPEARQYFTDQELVMLDPKNYKIWFEKIEYYLKHEVERKKIQKLGTKRSLKDHTYHNRVDQVISLYNEL